MDHIELGHEATDEQTSLGDIRVNHSVVASIVRLAALEVSGVCGVGAGIVDGIADLFSKRESDRGVKVSEDPEGNYLIEIRTVMDFGTELAKTAYQVQLTVRDRLTAMTGKGVAKVDVVIEGVRMARERREDPARLEKGEVWPETPHSD
ncbi:hypothetical protein ASA1KI_04540 [Opitutales bacterium ASA1]|uniref:Asp23/Gls24 family envelope stress response protein n=1 Tax=Congregicoccus parvus TaxID=3081749 RepID=UPI002B2905F7|nr:hypothetical protein ASA1KI_04540 [Opitutales bacterium ASA1]